jgi:hypothetical protein
VLKELILADIVVAARQLDPFHCVETAPRITKDSIGRNQLVGAIFKALFFETLFVVKKSLENAMREIWDNNSCSTAVVLLLFGMTPQFPWVLEMQTNRR